MSEFDQFPAVKSGFDQFPAVAQTPPAPQEASAVPPRRTGAPAGAMSSLLRGTAEEAFGIPSNVFDEQGNPQFEILGDLERTGGGDFIRTPNGELMGISTRDFVALDPRDDKLKVFAKPDMTPFERLEAGSKLLLAGSAAGAPSRIAGGAGMASGVPARLQRQDEIVAAAGRQGVDPTLATVSESRVAQGLSGTLREFPGSAPVIQRGAEREIGQVARGLQETAEGFGPATRPDQAGRAVRGGLEEFRASAGKEFDLRAVDDAELGSFIAQPSRKSSFSKKAAALYERANRALPFPNAKTRAVKANSVLAQIANRFDNPQLQEQFQSGFFGRLQSALEGPQTWRDLRQLRSEVRRLRPDKLSDAERTVDTAQIKRLESALTEDILRLTRDAGDAGAVKKLRDADTFYRSGIKRLDRAKDILKVKSDEDLYRRIVRMAGDTGGANAAALNSVRRSLGDEAWRDVASVAIRRMGEPTASAADAAIDGFSVSTFVTNFNKLSPQGKRVLFETTGEPELARALDDLATIGRGQKQTARMSVPTGGGKGIGRAAGIGAIAQIFGGLDGFMTAVGSAVGANVLARLMTNPRAVRALTTAFRASRGPDSAQRLPFAVNRLLLTLRRDEALAPLADRISGVMEDEGQSVAEEPEGQ